MKRLLMLSVTSLFLFTANASFAEAPETGWHKGFYILGNIGMTQVNNDNHIVTSVAFNGPINLSYGLTLGFDFVDWIGAYLSSIYSTTTSQVGTATGIAGLFPAGTFPNENAREHVVDVSLGARGTLPYFTEASWQPDVVKIVPFAKLGGTAHGLFVNAPTNANKVGAFGGGPSIGAGVEVIAWKGLTFDIEFLEHLIIQQEFRRTIVGIETAVTAGGFRPRFALHAGIGWHF